MELDGCVADEDEVSFAATAPDVLPELAEDIEELSLLLAVSEVEDELGDEELLLARLSLLLAARPVEERLSLEVLLEFALFIEVVSAEAEDDVELGLVLATLESVFAPELVLAVVSELEPLVEPVLEDERF